jgi:hypothetical protein
MEQPRSNGGVHSYSPYFVAGLIAGAGLALLLAPRSGAATRRAIGRKAGEGIDLLKAGATAGRDYISSCGADLDLGAGNGGRERTRRRRQDRLDPLGHRPRMVTSAPGPLLADHRAGVWSGGDRLWTRMPQHAAIRPAASTGRPRGGFPQKRKRNSDEFSRV